VGFLPLQSYIDESKTIKNGIKCPTEKEQLLRALVLRNHLESLGCSIENIKSE
jgi:hypothetical protein